MEARRLLAGDLPALERFWQMTPWSGHSSELRALAATAAAERMPGHRGLVAVAGEDVRGVALIRFVAGSVGTGEIECVAAVDRAAANVLLRAALDLLRADGARLTVAEYPGSPEWEDYEELLLEAGFRSSTTIADYFADGIPLRIAVI